MLMSVFSIMASFTAPEAVGSEPGAILWVVPLTAAIAVVYKAMKLSEIKTGTLIKEIFGLFCSIIVFMFLISLALYVFAWMFTE